jgi:hypothetical protein
VIADRSVTVLAHGLGGSTDLPVPPSFALVGAAWVLTFTFALVALAWRRPRFDPDKQGRAFDHLTHSATTATLLRTAGLLSASICCSADGRLLR